MGNSVEKLRKIDINSLDYCAAGAEIFLNRLDKEDPIFMAGKFAGRSGINLHLRDCSRYSEFSLNFDYKNPEALQELRELRDTAKDKYPVLDFTLKFPIEGLDIYVVNGKKAQ